MSETMALARLAIQKHQLSLIVLSALIAIGVVSSLTLAASGVPGEENFAIVALAMAMVPAVVWTFGMFSFASDRDMLLGESGYLHWMLRQPIADWKLALVPVTLKTMWTSAIWIVFASTIMTVTGAEIYLVTPAIGFSTIGIWLMVLMWRPFSNGWWRLAAFIACGLILWVLLVGVLIEVEKNDPTSSWWLKPAVTIGTYAMFGLGIWMSVRVVHLARSNSLGLIAEQRWTKAKSESVGEYQTRQHASPRSALVWHDLKKSSELLRWLVGLVAIPGVILPIVFIPFSVVGYVFVTSIFAYLGFGASSKILQAEKGNIELPPYLGASPLGTATIAWTRLLTILAIVVVSLSLSLLVFAGWSLFPSNQATFVGWSAEMAEKTGVASAGVGIAVATIVATFTFVIGRAMAYSWAPLCGRAWVLYTAVVMASSLFFVPLGVGIAWFLQQTDWESTQANALYWLTFLPWIVVPWLLTKLVLTVICVWQLRWRDLASAKPISAIIVVWTALTCLVSAILHLSLPYQWATLPWCFAAVAISTPLARVLVMPISLHFGRHQ